MNGAPFTPAAEPLPLPEDELGFGVVQTFPIVQFDDRGDLVRPPRQYATIVAQPEPRAA